MSAYTQNSYDIFVYKVLLPNLRTIFLGLACIAIACGSFLETNNSTKDCSFHNQMSLFEVSIFQNISDQYAITPTSITFGLWRQCYYYAQNCTCTPISLNYQLDAQQTILAATNNQTMSNLISTQSSYIKIIPLIMAIVFTLIAFLFSFLTKYTIIQIKHTIVHIGFILAAIIVLAIPYGYSIQTYKTSIMNACQQVDLQPVHCASMAARLEIIILGVSLGLLIFTIFLICCGVNKLDSTDNKIKEIYIDEKINSPSSSSNHHHNNNHNNNINNNNNNKRQSIMYNVQKISGFKSSSASQLSDYSSSTNNRPPYDTTTDEALDAWNNVAMLDGQHDMLNTMPLRPPPVNPNSRRSHELYQESHMNYPTAYNNNDDDHNNNNDTDNNYKYNNKKNMNNNIYNNNNNNNNQNNNNQQRISSSNTLGNTFNNNSSASQINNNNNNNNGKYKYQQQQLYNNNNNNSNSQELLPPTLPYVDNSQRRRRNSSQQSSSSSPQLPRPSSHASGNTFGANDMLLSGDLPSSTISFGMDDHHLHYQQLQQNGEGDGPYIRTTTPTSMTYRSERAESHGSICFTPTYSSGSNPRNSSGISYNRNHSQPYLFNQQQQEWNQIDYKRKNSNGSMTTNNNNNTNNKTSPSSPSPSSASSSSSSNHHQYSSQKYSNVPTLKSPPTSSSPSSRHPLSNKIINDERIGAYFQQQ